MKFPLTHFDDPLLKEIDNKVIVERETYNDRQQNFKSAHPKICGIPLVGTLASKTYSHQYLYVAILLMILGGFTFIKMPYFGVPFTGEHTLKYNTYVEPALYMSQHDDITWNQKKYVSEPVDNPEGIFLKFGNLPLFEWGLYLFYETIPGNSIETKTRLYTHFLGLLILIYSYLFFSYWLPKKNTLLLISLMAINPIISFGTFVTVLDSLAILCMFISFHSLNKFFRGHDFRKLYLSGIAFGVGISVKPSLILWMAPIAFVLMYYERKSVHSFIMDLAFYLLLGMLLILATKTSVSRFPSKNIIYFVLFGIWVGSFALLYRYVENTYGKISKAVDDLFIWNRNRMILALSVVSTAAGISFVFIATKYFRNYSNFITDETLLFNIPMYKYMILQQFKNYMTTNVFIFGIVGLFMLQTNTMNNCKKLTNAFLFGSVVYWIIASKVIFHHNYYSIIIMITFSLYASILIYYLIHKIDVKRNQMILVMLFAMLILPRSYRETVKLIKHYDDISGVVQFINTHTGEKDLLLHEGDLSSVAIYTGRGLVRPYRLISTEIKNQIKNIGFAETMRKYNIKYLITSHKGPSYIDYAPVFAETRIKEPQYNRNFIIFKKIGMKDSALEETYDDLEMIVRKYGIERKFLLEGEIGKCKIYSFSD